MEEKVHIWKKGTWHEYKKDLLSMREAYKFVAWVKENSVKVFISPVKEERRPEIYHKNIADLAVDHNLIDSEVGAPNAYGSVGVRFQGESEDCRIVLWRSSKYGKTSEEFRQPVREVLQLKDYDWGYK